LYMEQRDIDVEIPYVDMGLDSVIGVEWIQSLNKEHAINLPASCVYDYPTIRQLAGFLQKEVLKQGEGIKQTPTQVVSTYSLNDVPQQVQPSSPTLSPDWPPDEASPPLRSSDLPSDLASPAPILGQVSKVRSGAIALVGM